MLMKFNIYGISDSSAKEVGLSIYKRIMLISFHSKKLHAQIGQKKDFFSRGHKSWWKHNFSIGKKIKNITSLIYKPTKFYTFISRRKKVISVCNWGVTFETPCIFIVNQKTECVCVLATHEMRNYYNLNGKSVHVTVKKSINIL